MDNDLKTTLKALLIPFIIVIIMVVSHIAQLLGWISITSFGIYPLRSEGLPGIILTIFAHKDWNHLVSNAIPILLLGWALFYYYKVFALKSLVLMWILTGFWVWLFARYNYHVGASGLAYALASFHVLSAILRRVFRLMAFAMLVIFLYGGMVWGFFPELFPERNISWESHMMGALAGIVIAIYYRNRGVQRPIYEDDEDEDDDDTTAIWYHYVETEDKKEID